MAQLHINAIPQEFVETINAWGKDQMPPLKQNQVVLKIIADWCASINEKPNGGRQAEITRLEKESEQIEKKLSELRRK
ncbi:MAG: hypothetical protein GY726_16465 [Proteobacteria bacterium]|nr:hypothetical protein [Pseudomonadota bacterium]